VRVLVLRSGFDRVENVRLCCFDGNTDTDTDSERERERERDESSGSERVRDAPRDRKHTPRVRHQTLNPKP
jgi:hypothetical protein